MDQGHIFTEGGLKRLAEGASIWTPQFHQCNIHQSLMLSRPWRVVPTEPPVDPKKTEIDVLLRYMWTPQYVWFQFYTHKYIPWFFNSSLQHYNTFIGSVIGLLSWCSCPPALDLRTAVPCAANGLHCWYVWMLLNYSIFQVIQWCSWRVIHWPHLCTHAASASSSPFGWVKKAVAHQVLGLQDRSRATSWAALIVSVLVCIISFISTRPHLRPELSFECRDCQRSQLERGAGVKDHIPR